MSLLTIKRSLTPSNFDDGSPYETDEVDDSKDDFFASSGAAILQNHCGRRRSSVIYENEPLQYGLKKVVELLRKEDSLKLIVNLERVNNEIQGNRFFCLISTVQSDDDEEFIVLGIDTSNKTATIGLVLPIYQDMSVKLDGDGGFQILTSKGSKLFKPSSVHAFWTSVHLLNKACLIANQKNYYMGGVHYGWKEYYENKILSTRAQIAEWNRMCNADVNYNSNLAPSSAVGEFVMGPQMSEDRKNKDIIRTELKQIMINEDMDTISVMDLREKLEEKVSFELKPYRSFISEEVLIIYGQMDEASQILPYLYLGSTYNAANFEELKNKKITHILNVTKETENFFREDFVYKNVEVSDDDDTDLMRHFNDCHVFINQVKRLTGVNEERACLVHCQRGISRSASIVIAYLMKESNYTYEEAFEYVKKKRECIRPNDGFRKQLLTYEGILQASSHRHNEKFKTANRVAIRSFPNEILPITSESGSTTVSPTMPVHDAIRSKSAIEVDGVFITNQSNSGDPNGDSYEAKNGSNCYREVSKGRDRVRSMEMNIDNRGCRSQSQTESCGSGQAEFYGLKKSFRIKEDKSWIRQKDKSIDEDINSSTIELPQRSNSLTELSTLPPDYTIYPRTQTDDIAIDKTH